jgi:hypothetical protein
MGEWWKMSRAGMICGFVFLLCVAFCATIYFGYNKITVLKEELESLTDEYNGLNRETTMMVQRKQAYISAFNELDKLKVGVGQNVDFYSEAQQAILRGGARVLSNSPNAPKDGRISMKMSFIGDYYSIIKAFAELRRLPNIVRVVTLNLASTNPDTSVVSEVKADVLLEALSYR